MQRANSSEAQQPQSQQTAASSQFDPSTVRNIEKMLRELEYLRQANQKIANEASIIAASSYYDREFEFNSTEQYPTGFLQPRAPVQTQIREVKEFTSKIMSNLVESSLTLDRISQETKKLEKYVVVPNGQQQYVQLSQIEIETTTLRSKPTNEYENMLCEQLVDEEEALAEEREPPGMHRTFHELVDEEWNIQLHKINRTLNRCIHEVEDM